MFQKAFLCALALGSSANAAAIARQVSTSVPGGCNPAHPGSCPTPTSIPGGCNPAHPGSCPSTAAVVARQVSTSVPGGCNPAHPGSCPTPTSIPGGCNPAHPGSCPTPTSIPGGCNPAHPGSCPSTVAVVARQVSTSVPGGCNPAHPGSCPTPTSIPGGCNPAHPGSCPSTVAVVARQVTTSIPGGCNPAHPGSCPSSYFSTTAATPVATSIPGGCNPAHPGSCPTPSAIGPVAAEASPVKVDGEFWTVANLTRYCLADNTGCDYNFVMEADNKTEKCTVVRLPVANAATESWADQPCSINSTFTASWGYVSEPAPAYAVLTLVSGEEIAWFGVADVNGQEVTPSNPFGSGDFGTIGPEQVYTFN